MSLQVSTNTHAGRGSSAPLAWSPADGIPCTVRIQYVLRTHEHSTVPWYAADDFTFHESLGNLWLETGQFAPCSAIAALPLRPFQSTVYSAYYRNAHAGQLEVSTRKEGPIALVSCSRLTSSGILPS